MLLNTISEEHGPSHNQLHASLQPCVCVCWWGGVQMFRPGPLTVDPGSLMPGPNGCFTNKEPPFYPCVKWV